MKTTLLPMNRVLVGRASSRAVRFMVPMRSKKESSLSMNPPSIVALVSCLLTAHAEDTGLPARWRPETTDWNWATNLAIGDWGFNRPGYPGGLYIHGITKPAQNQRRVLPRPEKAEGKDNDANSGEWRQLTEPRVPLLDHIVKQFQTRGEYCQGPKKGDGYLDGTFLHAWLPGIFDGAALKDIRGSQVLHVTRFTAANENRVKAFAHFRLLNPQVYLRGRVGLGRTDRDAGQRR